MKTEPTKLPRPLSLIGGQPRFGPGNLAPPPLNTVLARRYIYGKTFPDKFKKVMKQKMRLYMDSACFERCVNPSHMYTKDDK